MIHKQLMNSQVKYTKIVFLKGAMLLYLEVVSELYYFCPHINTASLRCYRASNVSFNFLQQTRTNLLLDVCNAAQAFISTLTLHFLAVKSHNHRYELVSLTDLIQLIIKGLFQLVSH